MIVKKIIEKEWKELFTLTEKERQAFEELFAWEADSMKSSFVLGRK